MRTQNTLRRRWLLAAATVTTVASLGLTPAVTVVAAASQAPGARTAGGWLTDTAEWTNQSTTGLTVQQAAQAIGATSTATGGLDGTGVGVALIDTGVAQVPGLPAAQIVNGPDLSFESQATNLRYLDTYGHGTHLAGIMVGNDSTVGLKGIAPKAKLTSIKVGSADGAVDASQVIAAIDWVVENRNYNPSYPIKVINLAWGTDGAQKVEMDPISFAVENAWRKGIVVVVAGGNGGGQTTNLANPAYNRYVLTVGSSATKGTASQSDDEISAFTTTSTTRNVDLLAPGESVSSLRVPAGDVDLTYPTARVGTRLFKGSGTSQASAVVSGAVALLLQKRPTLTPDQVKSLLVTYGTKITRGPAAGIGLPELNLANALSKATPTTTQTWAAAYGTGSLENARGHTHVFHDGLPLQGEFDVFGPFHPAVWAQESANNNSWVGGVWMGKRMTGDGWTGSSWASKTWAGVTWSGGDWGDQAWYDDTWSGRYWASGSWSGRYWAGRYWAADIWQAAYWG